ncbi:uncharacterized protein EI90DRAFT_2015627 [Cantharellus anzutake]|uniref:uncharacterized protein n=1 Tax=Cantharellus anzutake TaxID=1750568 RepID=UPI00190642CD|nr:uncharacterized protein EI90DRAFT_2015627 [Cantharellus anzutake]KAF8325773.1 hypothetical protein EI90DRAFT_2015627 [Cantharellus anzutake]
MVTGKRGPRCASCVDSRATLPRSVQALRLPRKVERLLGYAIGVFNYLFGCAHGSLFTSSTRRCGSAEHTLKECKEKTDPQNPLPFASCFVCSEKGHLSGKCPKNENGLYPNGGGCRMCGMKDHLAKDCDVRSAGK